MINLTEQLIEQINKMDAKQQQRLLNFVRVLAKTPDVKGESGASIITATGYFDAQSLDEMETAIAEGCEEIDWRGWDKFLLDTNAIIALQREDEAQRNY